MSKHLPTKYGAIAASAPPPAEVRAIEDARVINAKPDEDRFAEAERAFRRALLEPPKTREQIVEDTKRQIAELDAMAARRR